MATVADITEAEVLTAAKTFMEQGIEAIPGPLLQGLCRKFGGKEGFRTRCMASTLGDFDPADQAAFCNALKIACVGTAEAARESTPAGQMDFMEFAGGGLGRVDVRRDGDRVTSAVVRGVKVLGTHSTNINPDGTRNAYTQEARRKAVQERVYEGARVYVDHPPADKAGQERAYGDGFGWLEGVRDTTTGLVGDLHVNPHHPLAEQFLWDAQNRPQNVGLSHNARGTGLVEGQETRIKHITKVRSVDVVSAGATTRTLFEGQRGDGTMTTTIPTRGATRVSRDMREVAAADYAQEAMTALQELLQSEADEEAKREALAGIAQKLIDQLAMGAEEAPAEEAHAETAQAAEAPTTEGAREHGQDVDVLQLQESVRKLETELRRERLTARREKELRESRLPAYAQGALWRERYLTEEDDSKARALLEEQRAMAWRQQPVSRDPGGASSSLTADSMAQRLGLG